MPYDSIARENAVDVRTVQALDLPGATVLIEATCYEKLSPAELAAALQPLCELLRRHQDRPKEEPLWEDF